MRLVLISLRFSLLLAMPLWAGPKVLDQGKKIVFQDHMPGLARFELKTVRQAQATIQLDAPAQVVAAIQKSGMLFSRPEVTSLYSQYLQNKANLSRAEKNLARVRDMYKSQAASAQDLNSAENEFSGAQASKNESEGNLKTAGFSVGDLGEAKAKTVWVFADVTENQVSDLHTGAQVKATFNAFPGQVFTGKIAAIGETISPDTRTVKIRMVLDNAKNLIKPGMFAQCELVLASQSAIALPLSALVTVEQQNYVFVALSKSEFERRAVSLSSVSDSECFVASGLRPNDQVVTSGAILLKGLSFGY